MAKSADLRPIYNEETGEQVMTSRTNAWDVVENLQVPGWRYGTAPNTDPDPAEDEDEVVESGEEPDAPAAPGPQDIEPAKPDEFNRDELLELALSRGLQVDRRWGAEKLRAALNAADEEEEDIPQTPVGEEEDTPQTPDET